MQKNLSIITNLKNNFYDNYKNKYNLNIFNIEEKNFINTLEQSQDNCIILTDLLLNREDILWFNNIETDVNMNDYINKVIYSKKIKLIKIKKFQETFYNIIDIVNFLYNINKNELNNIWSGIKNCSRYFFANKKIIMIGGGKRSTNDIINKFDLKIVINQFFVKSSRSVIRKDNGEINTNKYNINGITTNNILYYCGSFKCVNNLNYCIQNNINFFSKEEILIPKVSNFKKLKNCYYIEKNKQTNFDINVKKFFGLEKPNIITGNQILIFLLSNKFNDYTFQINVTGISRNISNYCAIEEVNGKKVLKVKYNNYTEYIENVRDLDILELNDINNNKVKDFIELIYYNDLVNFI